MLDATDCPSMYRNYSSAILFTLTAVVDVSTQAQTFYFRVELPGYRKFDICAGNGEIVDVSFCALSFLT